jgi:hypothetical protein
MKIVINQLGRLTRKSLAEVTASLKHGYSLLMPPNRPTLKRRVRTKDLKELIR